METNGKYYWIKLKDDFFDEKRIRKLRTLENGNEFALIYLKLMLKSIKSNGILSFMGLEDTFAGELALEINEDPERVRETLSFLTRFGLAEINNDEIYIPSAVENTGEECSSARRVREYRRRKSEAGSCNNDVTLHVTTGVTPVTNDVTEHVTDVTQECNTEKDKETEKDIYKEKSETRKQNAETEENNDDEIYPEGECNVTCISYAEAEEMGNVWPDDEEYGCPPPASPSLNKRDDLYSEFTVPLKDGDCYRITKTEIIELAERFPLVDINTELRDVVKWADTHPDKRKSKIEMKGVISRWMSEKQTRAENARKKINYSNNSDNNYSDEKSAVRQGSIDIKSAEERAMRGEFSIRKRERS